MNLKINAGKTARHLLVLAIALLAAHLAGQFSRFYLDHDYVKGLVPLFNLGVEANVPTWYSSMLLAMAGCLLALIAAANRDEESHYARHWRVLSALFFLLSLDETVQVHERITGPLRSWFGASSVVEFALVIALSVAYRRWLRDLPVRTRLLFITAAVLYVTGAVGLEMFEGRLADSGRYMDDATFVALVTIEESLEISGLVVFVYGLASYLASLKISFSLTDD